MEYNISLPARTVVVSEEEWKGVYEINDLYPGYGHTLGTSLRRIILSSLPGAAVTQIKIDGVSHEFTTVPGVLEDVVTLLLNFKQLRFRMHGEEPVVATIDIKGAKDVKGKDIKCPSQLEVVNLDHHLATVTDKSKNFKVEITVERGLGFIPSEELVKEKIPVGALILDAIFTPIRRVNYEVENMRVGDRTDYNRLRLIIETDGTIKPRDAFKRSLEIMRKQIEQISVLEEEAPAEGSKLTKGTLELDISQRAKNALMLAGISTPEELSAKSADELLSMEGIGEKAIGEIKKALENLGLTLKG